MTDKRRSHHPLEGGSRVDAYAFDPRDLTLLTDKGDPLYDKRVEDPISREFVLDIAIRGPHTPIAVRRRDPNRIVVRGKQRTKACHVLNALTAAVPYTGDVKAIHTAIKEFGAALDFVKQLTTFTRGKSLKLKVMAANAGDDRDARLAMRSENAHRHGDLLAERVRYIQDEIEKYGTAPEDLALAEGVSVATIRRWSKMNTTTRTPKKKRGKASRPSRKQIETMYESHRDKLSMRERAIFDWVLGSTNDVGGLFPEATARVQTHGHA